MDFVGLLAAESVVLGLYIVTMQNYEHDKLNTKIIIKKNNNENDANYTCNEQKSFELYQKFRVALFQKVSL